MIKEKDSTWTGYNTNEIECWMIVRESPLKEDQFKSDGVQLCEHTELEYGYYCHHTLEIFKSKAMAEFIKKEKYDNGKFNKGYWNYKVIPCKVKIEEIFDNQVITTDKAEKMIKKEYKTKKGLIGAVNGVINLFT